MATDLEELMAKMPPLSGEAKFPTLDIMGQQTEAAVNPPQPLVGGQQSRAEAIGGTAMDVAGTIGGNILTGARQGITNLIQGPSVAADVLFNPTQPSLSDAMSQRGVGVPDFSGETPTPQVPDTGVFTPAGEQTFGQVTTAPQLGQTATGDIGIQPQVPNAQPAGGLPMIDGFDPNGVTFPTLGNPQLEQREAQIAQRVAGLTPEQRAQEIAMNDAAVNKAQIRGEEARGLFRPSEAQIGQAQTEAVARQADYEQRQINNRIDSDVKQFERDNPRATEQEIAMHRQQLIQQESLAGKEEVAGQGGMTFEQNLAREKLNLDKAKFVDSVVSRGEEAAPLTPAQKEFAKKSGEGAFDWDQGGRASAQENIGKFQTVLTDLEDGNLDTRTLVEFAPFVGDWARSAVNPTGQQGLDTIRGVIFQGLRDTLGAQFTEREGERLVSASYNPKLDEASNVARLKPALARMRETFQAKEALTQHILNGGSVADYQGKTPWEVYKGGGSSASQGSPIEGDVDDRSLDDALL